MKKLLLLAFFGMTLLSCTENNRARNWGGSETIQLDEGIRLVTATFKGNDLWILVKKDTTLPNTYYFKEKSNFGVMQGQVIIIEK